MSANAASLRRILRSIGTHALPAPANALIGNRGPALGVHGGISRYNASTTGRAPRRDSAAARATENPNLKVRGRSTRCILESEGDGIAVHDGRPVDHTDLLRGAAVDGTAATGARDGGGGGGSGRAVGDHVQGKAAANAGEARIPPEGGARPTFRIQRLRSTVRERAADDHDHFEATIKAAEGRQRDGPASRLKEGSELYKRYYDKVKEKQETRIKAQAMRRKLEFERRGRVRQERWRDILRMLEGGTPADLSAYIKRTETIRLPEGLLLSFTRDPGETILHVMQQTESHIQGFPGKMDKYFPALTLYGTPAQNAYAKQLLQDSDMMQAVSQDDLNASKSLTDYDLQVQISDRYGEAIEEEDEKDPLNDLAARWNDEVDDPEQHEPESTVKYVDTRVPTHAVWSNKACAGTGVVAVERNDSRPSKLEPITAASSLPASALSFAAKIKDLVTPVPRSVWRQYLNRFQTRIAPQDLIRDELVVLLTDSSNANLITADAVRFALHFLARHMFFPAIRHILTGLEESNISLKTEMFNILLNAAAKAEDIHNFQYLTRMMRRRDLLPNAATWVHFQTLMMRRLPARAEEISNRLREKFEASPRTRIQTVEESAAASLRAYQAKVPEGSIVDFLTEARHKAPGLRFFTSFYANALIKVLLEQGKTNEALTVVDELVRQGHQRPSHVTLHTFLSAAKNAGDVGMAVAVLRKFHDLRVRATPMAGRESAETSQPQESGTGRDSEAESNLIPHQSLAPLVRTVELSVALSQTAFMELLRLAWRKSYWNLFRVVWRYACCAGHVAMSFENKMKQSIASVASLTMSAKDIASEPASRIDGAVEVKDDAGETSPSFTRGQLRNAWLARFAVGIADDMEASRSDAADSDDLLDATGHWDSDSSSAGALKPVDEAPVSQGRQAGQKRTPKLMDLVDKDLAEVQNLQPILPLAEMAERALRLDRRWKERFLGSPKGLSEHQYGHEMLKVMLKEGIKVPMKAGNAVGMRV